jgi:hypothetical protein
MNPLDTRSRGQIERLLGRPLTPEELVPADTPEALSEPVLKVARQLRARHLVLCTIYLHSLVPTRGRGMAEFIDHLDDAT